jgi:hypothetical protein
VWPSTRRGYPSAGDAAGCRPDTELTEVFATVLGNLAAGGQPLKSAVCQACSSLSLLRLTVNPQE